MNELGIDVFEAAAMFWGGGYDPVAEVLSEEPFVGRHLTDRRRVSASAHGDLPCSARRRREPAPGLTIDSAATLVGVARTP